MRAGDGGTIGVVERRSDLVVHSKGPGDTGTVAAALASLVVSGDVLVLGGDLGAGKTTFTKAFGSALSVDEPITSPTFTLAQQYLSGRLPLHHLDVYRIDSLDEVIDLALPELFESGGVVVIEWGDTIAPALPTSLLYVRFGFGDVDTPDDRQIHLTAVGSQWLTRLEPIREMLMPLTLNPSPTDSQGSPC